MKIKNQLVTSRARTSGEGNPCTSITVHETGNTDPGADAQAHANLQSNGNVRQASWHITVDDKQAIRSFPDTVKCWHAGDATGKAALDRLASGQRNVAMAGTPEGALNAAALTTAAATTAPKPQREAAQGSAARQARAVPVDKKGVKEIQTRLAAAGYKVGRPDGHLGKRTAAAIRAYQKANGLPVDGRATQALLGHLRGGAGRG